jgi:hypothetical protein
MSAYLGFVRNLLIENFTSHLLNLPVVALVIEYYSTDSVKLDLLVSIWREPVDKDNTLVLLLLIWLLRPCVFFKH